METIAYRMFFGDRPATRDQLDRFEQITVQQEVDLAWEARLELPLCTDANGNWSAESDRFLSSFQRVRVEVQVGTADWAPLIDGPITGYENQMSGEPGRSMMTLQVRDDTVYLHRNEEVQNFRNRGISEVALDLLTAPPSIPDAEAESVDAPPPESIVQRGTAMQILRELARCVNKHAYVLPGSRPGKSKGFFKSFPTRKDGLPDLVLTGKDRNVGSLQVTIESTSPGIHRGSTLNLTDRGLQQGSSTMQDLTLLGTDPPLEDGVDPANRLLSPDCVRLAGPDAAARAATNRNSYSFRAEGHVVSNCYSGVLSPYRLVTVRGANGRLSGDYLLTKVTHTLNRNFYGQAFSLARNARSAGAGGGGGPLENIF